MKNFKLFLSPRKRAWLAFLILFAVCTAAGAGLGLAQPASAASSPAPTTQTAYAGPQACADCHQVIHTNWQDTRHAHAFASPIFQRDWTAQGSNTNCLECHTTGYDSASGSYSVEGVTCESCHGPFNSRHPAEPMSVTPNAELCATCHKNTTDEWSASAHGQQGIQCEACHNPHSQTPMAATVTELCSNCHKERGSSFTHGTHANAGLECSNCHMYTAPRTDSPIGGLVPTGHTFSVGSDACVGCHQDTVHSRDEIIKLSGSISETNVASVDEMKKQLATQEQTISALEASNSVRLYTGLAQGAIIGLLTGGVAAWIVSRRIEVVEVSENG